MKNLLLYLLISCSLFISINSIAQQKLPYSFTHKLKTAVPKHEISLTDSEKQTLTRKEKVIKKEWEQNFKELAKMEKVKNGATVWRVTFEAPDAKNIGFKFNTCDLSENSQLFFYDEVNELVIGPINKKNLHETQQTTDFRPYLYIPRLFRNKITIELYEPKAEESNIILNQIFANHKSYSKALLNKWKDNIPVFYAYKKDELLKKIANKTAERRAILQMSEFHKSVDIKLNSHGSWKELPNGDRVWRLKIKSFMAERLVLAGKSEIPIGAKVFTYNSLKTYVDDEYHKTLNNTFHWSGTGSECIVEYYEPAAVKNKGFIHITTISHSISKESVVLAEKLYLPNNSQKTRNK